jgi:imidazolonepropionase
MATLISNIKRLVGVREENRILRGSELAELPSIENAFLIIEDGRIAGYGEMSKIHDAYPHVPSGKNQNSIDAAGQFILPCWCDSHTHLVFAASREDEFVDKIKGLSYEEIAAKGGGILNSARKLN